MNAITKRAARLPLLTLMTAAGLAWAQGPFDQPPPSEVEEALRSRITQFYDLFQKGKFREAEQFVAEDSRESYYRVQKDRILGFSIKEIYFGSEFKTAKALLTLKTIVPFVGSTPVDVPMGTQWAWTDENWYLVLPTARPGDRIQTPFGPKTIGPETSGLPGSSGGQVEMPDIAALRKKYVDELPLTPAAPGSRAPRAQKSILSLSLVQTQSKARKEFIVSMTGKNIPIVPGAVDGWVYAVQQQNGSTHFVGWASDGAHRKLAQLVTVFVDGEANHERHTSLRRPDVGKFFKFLHLRSAGFQVEVPGSVFDQDPAPVVRVFAVSRTREASELHYLQQYVDGPRTIKLGRESTALRARKSTLSYSLVPAHPKAPEESIVSLTGATIRIVPDAMDGWVDAVRQWTGGTLLSGWASDGAHREPAHQIVVFLDGEANQEPHTVWSRPGLASHFQAPLLSDAGFRVVVPVSVFDRDPAPVVRVFAISGTGVASEIRYHREYVDGTSAIKLGKESKAPRAGESKLSYSLVQTQSGIPEESIVSLSGTTIRIVPNAVDGWVDSVRQRAGGRGTLFSGWASDGAHREPAHQVLVFLDSAADHERHTVWRRPGVAKTHKARLLSDAGFQVVVPVSVFDRDPAPVVRVFAMSRTGVASEIRYHPEYVDGPRAIKLGKD